MSRAGRKPLTTGHVDRLYGSARAKDRLRVLLETLQGTFTIPEACERLGINEARFHDLRRKWLQESLELLEPRPVGRPPKQDDPADLSQRCAQLQAEVTRLRTQLQEAQVRQELAQMLANPAGGPGKKKDGPTLSLAKPR